MEALAVGAATRDITPSWPVSLAGFASRQGTTGAVNRPIHVRAAILDDSRDRLVIASADLLNWGAEQAPRLRETLAGVAGTTPDHVLLAATHAHSSPQTSLRVSHFIGVADPRYLDRLTQQTVAATTEALTRLRPARGVRASGDFALGRYRRVFDGMSVAHRFCDNGPADPLLTAVRYLDDHDQPIATLVHYTCHPVIVADDAVSPDFAGHAMTVLEAQTGAPALYLQGCCGDINPDFRGGSSHLIQRGTDNDIQRVGSDLAARVTSLLAEEATPIAPERLTASDCRVALPLQPLPDRDTLARKAAGSGPEAEWARLMFERFDALTASVPVTVQAMRLGEHLGIIACNAELSVEYGLHVRETTGRSVLPVAYANGMVGYVTTARQISEGGYEPVESILYYALPASFAPDVEARLTGAFDQIAEGIT